MRALVIVHQQDAGPGVFLDVLREGEVQIDLWHPAEESQPPQEAPAYDAVITFGGAVHPTQDQQHPWLKTEKQALKQALKAGVPTLGVCLGAQLIAEASGTRTRPAAVPEIGWYEVKLTRASDNDPLFKDLPEDLTTVRRVDSAARKRSFQALEWHSYEVPLPAGATALAQSDTCLQAYRLGATAWGIQAHPEVTADDFQHWLETGPASDPSWDLLGVDADELQSETDEKLDRWQRLGRTLLERFLAYAAERAADR